MLFTLQKQTKKGNDKDENKYKQKFYLSPTPMVDTTGLDQGTKLQGVQILYTYIHTCIHTHTHTYIYTHIQIDIYTSTYTNIYI